MRDFVAIAPINYSDLVLVAHPSVKASSVKELVAQAKSQPGKINYASSGPGTPYHMRPAIEMAANAVMTPSASVAPSASSVNEAVKS